MSAMLVDISGTVKQILKIVPSVKKLIILEGKKHSKKSNERKIMSKEKVRDLKKEKRGLARLGLLEDDNQVFGIDKNRLDDEWLGQPKKYFRWAVMLEDARAEFEEIKAEFDVTKAEVDLAIRTNPDEYDLPKVTDKAIAAAMIVQPEYKDAQQKVFAAKHRVGILQAAVSALDHRKKALEKLVDLHGQKYFASPRASDDSREAVSEIEKQSARSKVKISSRRKKRQ